MGKLVLSGQHENYSSLTRHNNYYQTAQHGNTMKNISELLASSATDEHSAKILLIEGAPGIGKTILSKEIAYQWASNNLLQYKRLLFLVYLRNVNLSKVVSVEKFVQHVLQSETAAANLGDYLINSNGKDLVVVLDGYDELSEADRKNSFIADLIKRQVLSKCLLVITSRPSASLSLRNIADCRIEVVGFTEEDRLEYINSALPDSPEKVTALQNYLQSNPTINALCYIPLNMTILLCLSENGINHLPKTQTEMYKKFIEMTIIRFLEKTGENISHAALFNLKSLPHPHDLVFKELSRFAFEALKFDKLVFKLSEIQEMCPSLTAVPSNWNGLGLLNSFTYIEGGSNIVTYHFLHFSIQEYMAAYHISTLPDEMQIKLLKDTFWSVDYYNTWIMYVGITGGGTFPLKHFLSGNFLQIFTQLFKTGISKKYLHDKIKCLHIFQCLAEAQGSDLMLSLGKLFQNQEIDLSKQTLLPRDLNTLGFFLIRSINKHWKKLNLSRCNIGIAGFKILIERFVGKDTHSVVTIDGVDLSYNQLNFSSLVGLLNLLKAWKTTEFISIDNFVHDTETVCDIFKAVEDVILQSSDVVMLKTLLIGSFLFAYNLNENEMHELFLKTERIKTMYLINCKWHLNASETTSLLTKQKLANVHIFGNCLSYKILAAVSSTISQCDNPSLVIDDPYLSDKVADEIIYVLPDDISVSKGIILVISYSKIQGILNTYSLSSELSNLEKLHFIRRVRKLCSSCVPVVTSWDDNLQWHGNKSDGIAETFVNVLLSCKNTARLKIGIVGENVLIARALKYKAIIELLSNQVLTSVYLKSCDIGGNKLTDIAANNNCSFSLCLYILDCHIELLCILSLRIFSLRELFVHNTDNITSDDVETILSTCHHYTSVVVVTKDTLGACNPTSKQLAMAHKLEPSVTIWKFFNCNLNADTCKQIAVLLTSSKFLNELKFVCCNIGEMEVENLSNLLITESLAPPIVQTLYISSSKLAFTIPFELEEIICISNVVVDDSEYPFYNSVIKALPNVSISSELYIRLNNVTEEVADDIAAILLSSKCFKTVDVSENNIKAADVAIITKGLLNLSSLSELRINGNNITEKAASDIANVILNNNKLRTLDIGRNKFQAAGMIKIAKALQRCSFLSELNIEWNGIDKEAADDIAAVIFNNHNVQILNFSYNNLAAGIIKIAKALQTISSLFELHIGWSNATAEAADVIAAVLLNNNKLQVLNVGNNNLKTAGMITIAKALQNVSSLSELNIGWNNVTEEAAEDIAAVVQKNNKLQVLHCGGNNFKSAGVMTIAKALQNVTFLTHLHMNSMKYTDEAADDIAAVVLSNINLRELDLSDNLLQADGAVKIVQAVQSVSLFLRLSIADNPISKLARDEIATILSRSINVDWEM